MSFDFYASVDTNINDIKKFNDKLVELISNYIDDDELIFDIKLILNELVINSALHGNMMDESKSIEVSVHIADLGISIIVKDEGTGIKVPVKCTCSDQSLMGGRGLGIVGALVDELETCYNRVACVKYFR
ncbi:MAG: ATP-binding protein [Ezakiella sp.]|nr:ATP-binding protein [Ezakiella sp.]MDD7761417.1 ATP-binding protein [Bacillota bacterium]MDY3946492.1 ATP-binding protein [Ezakiella sp.]